VSNMLLESLGGLMYRTLLNFNYSVLVSERNYRISQSYSWRRGVEVDLIASTFSYFSFARS